MQIEIKYISRVVSGANGKITNIDSEKILSEIHDIEDPDAKLSQYFTNKITGLEVEDCGIRFEYAADSKKLHCIAIYSVDKKPTPQQLKILVDESTKQFSYCGYYGVDGLIMNLENKDYYIHLVDSDQLDPVSIETIE